MVSKIQERLVNQLKAKGIGKKGSYAISTAALQKSGNLKKGTNKATKKGIKRGNMSPKEREKTRNA